MKKNILLLLLIIPFFSFSQDAITYKSGGRVFNSSNQKLTGTEIRNLFASNPEALKLYNFGKTKQTLGNILLYGGITTVVIKHISALNRANDGPNFESYSNVLYFVGAGAVLIAIPIKIGFSKKIKNAVSLINEDLKNTKTGFNIDSTTFISNSNGFGISITF